MAQVLAVLVQVALVFVDIALVLVAVLAVGGHISLLMRTLRDLLRILPEKHKRGGKVSADVAGWLGRAKLMLDQ